MGRSNIQRITRNSAVEVVCIAIALQQHNRAMPATTYVAEISDRRLMPRIIDSMIVSRVLSQSRLFYAAPDVNKLKFYALKEDVYMRLQGLESKLAGFQNVKSPIGTVDARAFLAPILRRKYRLIYEKQRENSAP